MYMYIPSYDKNRYISDKRFNNISVGWCFIIKKIVCNHEPYVVFI